MKSIKHLVLISGILVLGACSTTKSIYYWGDYSESAYELKAEPTAESLSTHKNVLQEIISKAQSKNRRIPPGIYMELAKLEIEANNPVVARQLLLQEKSLFPESATMVAAVLKMIDGKESENANNN
ncbi:MAG: hypothetical protein ACJAV1_002489 [Paraglaciecola sp.]|jgi:hypothetical protein